jgi:hypothetical protein
MTMENKQTAVQWLEKICNDRGYYLMDGYFDQALQMEKEQISECWDTAHQAGRFEGKGIAEENWQTFDRYYAEAYGDQDEK